LFTAEYRAIDRRNGEEITNIIEVISPETLGDILTNARSHLINIILVLLAITYNVGGWT